MRWVKLTGEICFWSPLFNSWLIVVSSCFSLVRPVALVNDTGPVALEPVAPPVAPPVNPPVEPVLDPVAPVAPVDPVLSVGPVDDDAPVAPVLPVEPVLSAPPVIAAPPPVALPVAPPVLWLLAATD